MTITELLPMIRQLSSSDKLKRIRILAELYTNDNIFPLEPHKVYYLPTPYDSFGTGEILMQAMVK